MKDAAARDANSRYAEKREAVVAAATQVLNAQGAAGFTLAAVARLMGMHPVSLAYYFKSRDALLAECLSTTIQRYKDMVAAAAVHPTPKERVGAFICGYFEIVRRVALGLEAPMASFLELRRVDEASQSPLMVAFGEMVSGFRALFAGSAPHDADRVLRTLHARLLIEHLGWVRGWVSLYEPHEYPRVAERLADIVVNGLASPGRSWPDAEPMAIGAPLDRTVTRERFLVAATELINREGGDGASVDKISASLNVTKGSFYHHNTDKDELVIACFQRTFGLLKEAQATSTGADGWERLCAAVKALVRYQSVGDRGRLLSTYALATLEGEARRTMVRRFRDSAYRFAAIVSEGVADGSIRPVDPIIASQAIMALVNSSAFLERWATEASERDIVDLYARPGLMGLFTPR